jgi:hypothetical protein
MNCEQAQTILIGSTVDSQSTTWPQTASLKAAIDHISHCDECQVQAQFERQLGAWHNIPVHPNADVWNRIETQTSDRVLKLWMNPKNQKEKMKRNIITSSVAAATIMVGFGLISQSALASTPKDKFMSMKKAVLTATAKSGSKSPSGTAWFLDNEGNLIELTEGSSYSFVPDDKAKSVQGQPLDPTKPVVPSPGKSRIYQTKTVAGFPLKLDLNEKHYASIRFGKDQNELVLTQKGTSDMRYVVKLDKKTSAPTYLTLQKSLKGQWELVKGKQVTFQPYSVPLKGR